MNECSLEDTTNMCNVFLAHCDLVVFFFFFCLLAACYQDRIQFQEVHSTLQPMQKSIPTSMVWKFQRVTNCTKSFLEAAALIPSKVLGHHLSFTLKYKN